MQKIVRSVLPMLLLLNIAGGCSGPESINAQDSPNNNFVVGNKEEESDFRMTEPPEGYVLVWSDEFDSVQSLSDKWRFMDWEPGRVNHEFQTYRPAEAAIEDACGKIRHTAEIEDGKLVINCFKGKDGRIYSARMDTKEEGSRYNGLAGWKYGYFEARIKLPSGLGAWPAFWMMPADVDWSKENWPECGEIDIMEEVGADPDEVVCSLHASGHNHTNNTQVSARKHIDGMENGWITYSMLWDPYHIEMFADGQRILYYLNDHTGHVNWPYDRPYHLTLNLAWGGDWGGYKGTDESVLPVKMEVDYVRVYQKTQ